MMSSPVIPVVPLVPYAIMPVRDGVSAESVAAQASSRGSFRVTLAATPAPARLDRTFSSSHVDVTPRSFVLLGPPLEWLGHNVSPQVAREVGMGERSASLSGDRLVELTELVVSLCPFATAVVQPLANHMAFPAAEFARDAGSYLASRNPTPLWAYPKMSLDPDAAFLETTGMAAFGVPDVAMPVDPRQPEPFEALAFALMRAMIDSGPLPPGAVVAQKVIGELRVESLVHGALWIVPTALPLDPAHIERALGRIARRRALSALLGPHTHLRSPRTATTPATDQFHTTAAGPSLAMTSGVSERPQPGGTAQDRNVRVELLLRSGRLPSRSSAWLDWASRAIHEHDELHPVRELDRIVLPAPDSGIAAVLVWPFGHLLPQGRAGAPVHLWLLLPLLVDEVDRFRRDPDAQSAWIKEREAKQDLHLYEERWTAV